MKILGLSFSWKRAIGLMAVSSAFLATIAVTGAPALLGTKLLD